MSLAIERAKTKNSNCEVVDGDQAPLGTLTGTFLPFFLPFPSEGTLAIFVVSADLRLNLSFADLSVYS